MDVRRQQAYDDVIDSKEPTRLTLTLKYMLTIEGDVPKLSCWSMQGPKLSCYSNISVHKLKFVHYSYMYIKLALFDILCRASKTEHFGWHASLGGQNMYPLQTKAASRPQFCSY